MSFNVLPYVIKRESALKTMYGFNLGKSLIVDKTIIYMKVNEEVENIIGELTNSLEKDIQAEKSDTVRKKLINMKRSIFNRRSKSVSIENRILLTNFKTLKMFDDYVNKIKMVNTIKDEINMLYEETSHEERVFLYNLFEEDLGSITKSLKFIQPSIMDKLNNYFKVPVEEHNSKLRKMDITLSKVLTRASLKTSPFSTLTVSSFESLNTTPNKILQDMLPKDINYITKINESYIFRIFEKVIETKEILLKLVFNLIPTISIDENKIYWTVLNDNPNERSKIYRTQDRLITLPATDLIKQIYKDFNNKEFCYSEFEIVLNKFGVGEEKSFLYFLSLYKQQLILPKLAINQNKNNIIDECIKRLKVFDEPIVNYVIDNLEKINGILENFDNNDSKTQQQNFIHISKYLDNICDYLDIEKMDKGRMLYQDAVSSKIGIYNNENYIEHKESLCLLMQFFNVFNSPYIIKKLISKEFKNVYGLNKIRMDKNWEEIIRVLSDSYLKNIGIWGKQFSKDNNNYQNDLVNKINAQKNIFIDYIEENIENKDGIYIDKVFIDTILDNLPLDLFSERQSNSFFIQHNKEKLILNHFYEGNLTYYSRFIKLNSKIQKSEVLSKYITENIKKYNFLDVNSTFGFNANSRYNITDKKIQIMNIPDIGSDTDELIEYDWKKLEFSIDENDNLSVYHGNEKVTISFLGSLIPMLLPGVVAILTMFSRGVTLYSDFSKLIIDIAKNKMSYNDKVCIVPQVIFNNNIILSRKKWIINLEKIDLAFKDTIDKTLEYLIKNELPYRCFISNLEENYDFEKQSKPQYMDFTSPSLFKLFQQLIKESKYIILEEILPLYDREECSTEYILEITKGGRK